MNVTSEKLFKDTLNNIILLGIGIGAAFGASLDHIQMNKKNSSSEV